MATDSSSKHPSLSDNHPHAAETKFGWYIFEPTTEILKSNQVTANINFVRIEGPNIHQWKRLPFGDKPAPDLSISALH